MNYPSAKTVCHSYSKFSHVIPDTKRVSFIPSIFSPTTPFPRSSPNSCFQRTCRLLEGRQCSCVWTREEWGRSRETEERISSVRLARVRDMVQKKQKTKTKRETMLTPLLQHANELLLAIKVLYMFLWYILVIKVIK